MPVQPFILATAGHVDHGKSAVVKALTGTDPDRLPEEKARGITIDLGFAHLELPAPEGNRHGASRYSCGIVDVPGHEDFVKNMVAGVGSIDLALLIVAADDGWMPQTEEHLQILVYLGVTSAVVALTKADLAPDLEAVRSSIRARLTGTPFVNAPIIATSTVEGTGWDALRATLAEALAAQPASADIGKPRLWVDRVFTLKGIGTIATGTLSGGSLSRGDAVIVQPSGHASRVRACHSHGVEVDRVPPGTRTALNLPDLAADPLAPKSVNRGEVITLANLGGPHETFDVIIERSPRLKGSNALAAKPLKDGTQVHLHLGSAQLPARVRLLETDSLAPGERCLAQLRLARSVHAFAGDHFILRDGSQQATLGGGVILDPGAGRSHARAPTRLARLRDCLARASEPVPYLRLHLAEAGILRAGDLLLQSRFSTAEITRALGRMLKDGESVLAGPFLASAERWGAWRQLAIQAIDRHHHDHPDQPGPSLADLRSELQRARIPASASEALVADLLRTGFEARGNFLARASHQPTLPPALQGPGERIRQTLRLQPLDPPNRRELAPDAASQTALRFLLQSGEVIDLGPDVVLSAQAYTDARHRVQRLLRARREASASDIRKALETSRRIVIPLLERFDREGLTVRDGDLRRLSPPKEQRTAS